MRKRALFLTIPRTLVCAFALIANSAIASDVYVATNGVDSAARNGASSEPFGSIDYALTRVVDGDQIWVKPGTYTGRVRISGDFPNTGITIKSQTPYQAKLRNNAMVVSFYEAVGITLEGFDIAHTAAASGPLVIQVSGFGEGLTHDITLTNNVMHDSQNNDLLKINDAAYNVNVFGNLFYNQQGHDEHIDVNSVRNVNISRNVFASSLAQSGHADRIGALGSSIVIKDSNDDNDIFLGSQNIKVQRNVFVNWQGSGGSSFVLVGEDGKPYFEASDVLIENNLLIGNSPTVMRTPFGIKGARDVTIRNNTVTGDLPAAESGFRIVAEGNNQPAEDIRFYNNLWADPSGSMSRFARVDDTDDLDVASFVISHNLYWNNGAGIPGSTGALVSHTADPSRVHLDPQLPDPASAISPRLENGQFSDGSTTIQQVWRNLIEQFGQPQNVAIARGLTNEAPGIDMLGRLRDSQNTTIGAVEILSSAQPSVAPVIDVHPARADNQFDARKKQIWMNLYSSSINSGDAVDFDATSLVRSTIQFGRRTAGTGANIVRFTDIDKDGLVDAKLRFNVRKSTLNCNTRWAWLQLRTRSNQTVSVRQRVRFVGCG